MDMPPVPRVVGTLARRCRDLGGRAWLVGGGVRDHLLQRSVKDWDVEVFGVPAPELEKALGALGHVNKVGRAFGVFKLRTRNGPEIDVSIPRRDNKIGPGHRGISVTGDPDMTTREAARRRDLTINAILVDPLTGAVEDPFGGRDDLARGQLRAVDAGTFLEDPLRALRVVQFAARLDFEVDADLLELCREAALDELPAERIQGEWDKLLLRGTVPSRGLVVARAADILSRVFPEAAAADDPAVVDPALDALAQGPRDAIRPEGRRFALMLAAWLHGAGAAGVSATLDRLWLHTWKRYPLRRVVEAVVAHLDDPVQSDGDLRRLAVHAEPELVIEIRLALGDLTVPRDAWRRAESLGVLHAPPAPLLLGRHLHSLGFAPGPDMGLVLQFVYDLQLDGQIEDLDDARDAARTWRGGPG